jgi:hypothetical protein
MAKRKRGRPRKQFAKRNTTTRQGRKTGHDPVDSGTDELVAKRKALTQRSDLPHSDPIAALYGRDLISVAHYNAARDISDLIAIVGQEHVGSVWQRILSAPGGVLNFDPSPEVERAQNILHRLKNLIGDHFGLVFAICSGDWAPIVPILQRPKDKPHPWLKIITTSLDHVANRWSGTRAA